MATASFHNDWWVYRTPRPCGMSSSPKWTSPVPGMFVTTLRPIDSRTQPEFLGETTTTRSTTAPVSVAEWSERGVNPDRLRALRDHVDGSLLDVGCGSGAYVTTEELHARVFGCDIRKFDTWAASPTRFAIADAPRLPFRGGSFDTVSCFETIEHLPEPIETVRELTRVTKRLVIATTPNCERTEGMRRSGLVYGHHSDPTHVNFFDLPDLVALLEAAGLHIREARLINRLDLGPFIGEAFALPARVGRLLGRVNRRLGRRYEMTSLVVGEVPMVPSQEVHRSDQ